MASVNKVILIGNLGADPELRQTQSGMAVANIRLATTDNRKDRDGNRQEKTEWHRIVAFGRTAELCGQYLSKGRQVYIEGRLQTRSWDDKDGNKRYSTEIVADNVTFLSGGERGGSGAPADQGGYQSAPPSKPAPSRPDSPPPEDDDDLPF